MAGIFCDLKRGKAVKRRGEGWVSEISLKGRRCLVEEGVGLCDMHAPLDMPVVVGRERGVAWIGS